MVVSYMSALVSVCEDFNPSVVNNESLVDTAICVGESGTKKPRVHEEQSISGPVAKRHS